MTIESSNTMNPANLRNNPTTRLWFTETLYATRIAPLIANSHGTCRGCVFEEPLTRCILFEMNIPTHCNPHSSYNGEHIIWTDKPQTLEGN